MLVGTTNIQLEKFCLSSEIINRHPEACIINLCFHNLNLSVAKFVYIQIIDSIVKQHKYV